MDIDAVLFDYGGVYSDSPFDAVAELAPRLGVEPDRYLEIIFGPYDRDLDHPWHRLERGEIPIEKAREEIMEIGRADGIDADPFHFFAEMGRKGGGGVRQEVVDFTCELKASGLRTGLITNNAVEFREHWRKSVPLDQMFHVVIDSSEVGVRKPDPRIFELALEGLEGVAPERALFLDDYPGNLEAAARLGIRGVLVTADYRAAIRETRALVQGS